MNESDLPSAIDGTPRETTPNNNSPKRKLRSYKSELYMPLVGVLVGALISGSVSIWTQSLTSNYDSAAQQREKRSEVYFAYLNAADKYDVATENLLGHERQQTSKDLKPFTVPADLVKGFDDTRSTYQDEVNQLYVYGSDAAWSIHQRIASALPTSVSVDVGPLQIHNNPVIFTEGYGDFLSMACRELNAAPRLDC